jgi:hypothetical protein
LAYAYDLASQLSLILFFAIEIFSFQNFAVDIYSPQNFPITLSKKPSFWSMFGVKFLETRQICPFRTGWLNATTSVSLHTCTPLTTHNNHDVDGTTNNEVYDDGDGATGEGNDNATARQGAKPTMLAMVRGATGDEVNDDGNSARGYNNDKNGDGLCQQQ